jgi:hypothetical protein
MTVKNDDDALHAAQAMRERFSSAIEALTPSLTGFYKFTLAAVLEDLRDHSGLELDASTYKWAKKAEAIKEKIFFRMSFKPDDAAQDEWLQSRRREAEVILTQIRKAPTLAETFRTVKPAAQKRQAELTEAYHDLLCHVDLDGLRAMLKRCPPNKTGGPSGLTREHFLHLPDEILRCFLPFVNKLLDGEAPTALKLGTIVPMVKDAQRYRPITLLETLYKATTTLVSDRFYAMAAKFGILEPNQYAFRQGGTTAAPIDVATAVFEERSRPTHVIALDATSAYDTVNTLVLGSVFTRLGAPPRFTNWIMNTTGGHSRLISTPGGISESPFELGGLPQGDPMSCFVWLAVCDVALSHVANTRSRGVLLAAQGQVPGRPYDIRAKAQGYADDLMAFGETAEGVTETAQLMTDALGVMNIRVQAKKVCLPKKRSSGERRHRCAP